MQALLYTLTSRHSREIATPTFFLRGETLNALDTHERGRVALEYPCGMARPSTHFFCLSLWVIQGFSDTRTLWRALTSRFSGSSSQLQQMWLRSVFLYVLTSPSARDWILLLFFVAVPWTSIQGLPSCPMSVLFTLHSDATPQNRAFILFLIWGKYPEFAQFHLNTILVHPQGATLLLSQPWSSPCFY